jgi:hypothetical protein
MNKLLLFIVLIFIHPMRGSSTSQGTYPQAVEIVLRKAGKNRIELEKAITWCKKTGDPLKVKAVFFLIANMDAHYSADYYWADKNNDPIAFDEVSYPDFTSALKAFDAIKTKNPGIHPISVIKPDIYSVKGVFLINNINESFRAWKLSWAKNISFNDFCEYILPYRVCNEPLQDWRSIYSNKFAWITTKAKTGTPEQTLSYVYTDERNWFKDTWGMPNRNEPLPRLGAMQLLLRKSGKCEDIADLEVFTLRSQGIPATLNIIPYWATASDSHFVNTAFDGKMQPIQFDVSRTPAINNKLSREPSKVIRVTFAKQPGTVASIEPIKNIPDGFMRTVNYVDITEQYWKTTTVHCPLFPTPMQPKTAYICVFNGLKWCPTWWGTITNGIANFSAMSKGVVYLPIYYNNGKISPAGYPVAEGYQHNVVLDPDTIHRQPLLVENQDRYLLLQPGKTYKLMYWNNTWKILGKRTVLPGATNLMFLNVPRNALLLLVAENSKGFERPFMITDEGKRVWW